MKYIHIKNLEKYHPGYKDRTLQWAKIYFNMVQGNPNCEMITNEIDWSRLIRLILLELQARRPIPLDSLYLTRKGLDLRKRFLASTLEVLKPFIEVLDEHKMAKFCNETVTKPLPKSHVDKDKEKEEYREDKDKDKEVGWDDKYPYLIKAPFKEAFNHLLDMRKGMKAPATQRAKELILDTLHKYDIETAIKMLNKSIENSWKGVFEIKEGNNNGKKAIRTVEGNKSKYEGLGESI